MLVIVPLITAYELFFYNLLNFENLFRSLYTFSKLFNFKS